MVLALGVTFAEETNLWVLPGATNGITLDAIRPRLKTVILCYNAGSARRTDLAVMGFLLTKSKQQNGSVWPQIEDSPKRSITSQVATFPEKELTKTKLNR